MGYIFVHISRAYTDTKKLLQEHIVAEVTLVIGTPVVHWLIEDNNKLSLSSISSSLFFAVEFIAIILALMFVFHLLRSPFRIYNENMNTITTLKEKSAPKLDIFFKSGVSPFESIKYRSGEVHLRQGLKEPEIWKKIFRVKVHNPSGSTIKNVFVKIVSVEGGPSSWNADPDRLRFSYDETETQGFVDLNPGDGEIVSVYSWQKDSGGTKTVSFYMTNNTCPNILPGNFKITLQAYGEDIKPTEKIFFIEEVNGMSQTPSPASCSLKEQDLFMGISYLLKNYLVHANAMMI